MAPSASKAFPKTVIAAIDAAKILGVRAGARSDHRFIGVWVVVVDGRVFARSWGVRADGWYDTFRRERAGAIQAGKRPIRVRTRPVRSTRVLDAIERAYAEKYPTPGSKKWVRGFRTTLRRAATLEFLPA